MRKAFLKELRKIFNSTISLAMVFSLLTVPVNAEGDDTQPTEPANTEETAAPEEQTYTVDFYGKDDTVLVSETITEGQSAVAPNVPDVEGFTFEGWYNAERTVAVSFDNITADLNVYAKYSALESVDVAINYYLQGTTQKVANSYTASVVKGKTYAEAFSIASPVISGLKLVDSADATITFNSLTDNYTKDVFYEGETTTYKVTYRLQSLSDDSVYENTETVTLNGTVGAETAAAAKDYAGFTCKGVTQQIVLAGGATEVTIDYDRNYYTLSFDSNGGSYVAPRSLKYGAALEAGSTPTRLGYTFAGWTITGGSTTMPNHDVTAIASWTENDTATYTVIFWQQQVTDSKSAADSAKKYDFVAEETRDGDVGNSVEPDWYDENKDYVGFHYNSGKSVAVTVKSDGSTVLNVYYDRDIMTINFYVTSNRYTSLYQTMTGLYGSTLASNGYTWPTRYAWYYNNYRTQLTFLDAFINPSGGAATLDLYNDSNKTGATISHYKQNVDGSYGTAANSIETDYNTQWTFTNKYNGFTVSSYSTNDGQNWHACSAGQRVSYGTSLMVRYSRNSYTISFLNATGIDNKTLLFEAPLANAKPANESLIGRPAGVDSDYVFVGWYLDPAFQTPVDWSAKMPANNLAFYAKWVAPTKTVTFYTDSTTVYTTKTATKGTALAALPEAPAKEGYDFGGWYLDAACTEPFIETQLITTDLNVYAKWSSSDTVNYQIVCKDTAGNILVPVNAADSEVKTGKKNTKISIAAPSVAGISRRSSIRRSL